MLSLFLGVINNPLEVFPNSYGSLQDANSGPIVFMSNILKFIGVAGGIFALINIILAGIQFISSGGNTESVQKAWSRIYMSLIGLVLIVGAYAIAAIVGQILFGDSTAIINPQIYGPGAQP